MTSVGQVIFSRQTLAERAHAAARWGAMNPYDPERIRNLVLFGSATPGRDARPLLGLEASSVEVSNPGCPGPDCRVSVAIDGVRCVEPVE
jgi:hypothetical protein